MPVALFMALQFLREGRTQSILIASAMGVGVAVIIFLSALISGLQADLVRKTLGTQPHVSIHLPEQQPRSLWPREGIERGTEPTVLSRQERATQRARGITSWHRIVDDLERMPSVEAVSPVVSGAGFALRGGVSKSINLIGVIPDRYDRVIDVSDKLKRGRMVRGGTDAVIGVDLVDDLGLDVGDKLRIQAAGDRTDLFTVVGVFDLGNAEVNQRWVIAPLRATQTLTDQVGAVSQIDVRLPDPFEAQDVASVLRGRTGLEVESWMSTNAQLLSALRSQSMSSLVIQVFVIISVSIGIASVLVVSVVQRQRQIGILRAMGISRGKIGRIFVYQGGLLGLTGSALGVGLGSAMAQLFTMGTRSADGDGMFPIVLSAQLLATAATVAIVTGLVAAALPALRAARLDPAEAIRHD